MCKLEIRSKRSKFRKHKNMCQKHFKIPKMFTCSKLYSRVAFVREKQIDNMVGYVAFQLWSVHWVYRTIFRKLNERVIQHLFAERKLDIRKLFSYNIVVSRACAATQKNTKEHLLAIPASRLANSRFNRGHAGIQIS